MCLSVKVVERRESFCLASRLKRTCHGNFSFTVKSPGKRRGVTRGVKLPGKAGRPRQDAGRSASKPVVAPKRQLLLATLPQQGEACHLPSRKRENAAVRTAVVIRGGTHPGLAKEHERPLRAGSGTSRLEI